MPGFVIFVFVLTFAYVVYFSVMITLDLHSKKDEKKTDEETIDVSSMDNEEVPVSVEEHNDGPEGSDMTYTEQVTDDGLRVVIPTVPLLKRKSLNPLNRLLQLKSSIRKTKRTWKK